MNNEIYSLFYKVGRIASKKEGLELAALNRGEKFNIFEVLGIQRKETILHSPLLAELLNPKGRHGMGDKPLKQFLSDVCKDCLPFNASNAKVETEFFAGYKDEESKTGGRIDIIISDSAHNAIIIENKIEAKDQENQMYRYRDFGKRYYKNYVNFYLNKLGDPASELSVGSSLDDKVCLGDDYLTLSYKDDIIPWLKRCRDFAIDKPAIRIILECYIETLHSITGYNMNNTEKEEIFKCMDEHIEATAEIMSVQNEYPSYLVKTYIVPTLLDWAKGNELECKDVESFSTGKLYCGISFSKREWTKNIRLEFEKNNFKDLIYGIAGNNNPNAIATVEVAGLKNPNATWHYGWCDMPQYKELTPSNYAKIKAGTVANNYIAVLDNLYNAIIEKEIDMES